MDEPEDLTDRPSRPRHRWLALLAWSYAALTFAWWLTMRYAGDRWWPATMLLFAPRWPALLPGILLLAAAVWRRRRLLPLLLTTLVLIAWPIMGFHVTRLPLSGVKSSVELRVLTLNTHFADLDVARFHDLIRDEQPDVIVLQEWWNQNLNGVLDGMSAYPIRVSTNLALIATRFPVHLNGSSKNIGQTEDGIFYTYTVDLPGGPVEVINVHLASPHNSLSEVVHGEAFGVNRLRRNADARWNEAMQVHDLADRADGAVIIAGDFNLPADSPIYRKAFGSFNDAFTDGGLGYGWTYRTNRTNVRIDHILTGPAWSCDRAWVGPDVGSPHRPLIADFQRVR